MKIRRRVLKDADKKVYKEVTETVTLIKRNTLTVLVRLSNGDIVKRKLTDVIDLKEKGEKWYEINYTW